MSNKNQKKNITNNIIMSNNNNEEKKDITGREVKRQPRKKKTIKEEADYLYSLTSSKQASYISKIPQTKLTRLFTYTKNLRQRIPKTRRNQNKINKINTSYYTLRARNEENKNIKKIKGNRYTGTRANQLFRNTANITGNYRNDNRITLKSRLGISSKLKFDDYVRQNYLNGNKLYAVKAKVKLRLVKEAEDGEITFRDIIRLNTFIFKANPNLSPEQLRAVIWFKTLTYFESKPLYGFSDIEVLGLSFSSYTIPENFNIGKTRLYLQNYLKLNELEPYKDYEIKENCVLDYLDNELSKIYAKHTRKQLIERMKKYEPHFETDGFELITFKNMMKKYYPNVRYLIISPTYKLYDYYNEKHTMNNITLVFYFNNNHLYGITNEDVKKYIFNHKDKLEFLQFNDSKYEDYIVGDDFETENTNYILPEDIDYNEFKNELIEQTGHGIEYFNQKLFKHPTKNILIHPNNDYENRKQVYEKLNLGKWNNQSYPSISLELLNSINSLSSSNYNKESYYYLSTYHPLPIIDKIHESKNNKGIDINLHYSSIFYEDYPKIKIPIYDWFNTVKPYENEDIKIGEYYIEEFEIYNVKMGGCFYHYETVKYLLNNYITKKQIKYAINTNRYRTGEQFKDLIDITKQFDRDIFKQLNNMLNGMLNNNYHKINKENYYTESLDTFIYLLKESIDKNYEVHFEDEDEHYYLSRHKKTPNYQNTSSYYRTTLSLSLIRLIKLIEEYKQYKMVMIKTDCLFIETDEDIKLPKNTGHYTESMGKYKIEKKKDIDEVKRYKPKPFIPYEKKDNITLLLGCGGLGKSYKIINETDEKEKTLLLSPTNAALINLINKTIKIKKHQPTTWKFSTVALLIHSFNHNFTNTLKEIEKYDNIILDEVVMSSNEILRVLVCSKKNIILMGDVKQLPKLGEYNIEKYDIMEAKQLFNIRYKKFIDGKSRYDKTTYDIINKFVKTGTIPTEIKQSNNEEINDNVFHIVSYNKTRKKITKEITKLYDDKVTFNYVKYEKYGVCENMPIISTTNKLKKHNIFNNWTGTLKSFNNNKYIIHGIMEDFKEQDLELDLKMFSNNFIPFYASTIHRFQGQTLHKNYYIHDTHDEFCSKNSLYTSLSRCKNYKQITIIGETQLKYKPDKIVKELIDMKPSKKEVFIYDIQYECNHKHNTIESFNEVNPDIECKNTKTLLKNGFMDKKAIERFIYNIKKEKAIDTRKFNLDCFKVKKKRVQNNKITISNDCLTLSYYIDNKRKQKLIRFKKIGLDKARLKMNEFIKENDILIS